MTRISKALEAKRQHGGMTSVALGPKKKPVMSRHSQSRDVPWLLKNPFQDISFPQLQKSRHAGDISSCAEHEH
jgi:hypothetical protein